MELFCLTSSSKYKSAAIPGGTFNEYPAFGNTRNHKETGYYNSLIKNKKDIEQNLYSLQTVIAPDIGIILAFLGAKLGSNLQHFTTVVAPVILILMGIFFIYRHHRHKHFHVDGDIKKKKTKKAIITALVIAMFFSPCMEIEAYFLLAGAYSGWLIWFIALLYLLITTAGMVVLVRLAYKGLLKLNWHSLEHNAGIITGFTLVATGIITFFIQ